MKTCVVIINPSSGKEKATEYESQIKKQLQSYNIVIKQTEKEGDAKLFAQQACKQKVDAVVLVGGDGTVNEGINGIAEQSYRPVVGIVPLGTVNDFARALNISLDPEEAIQQLGNKTTYADIGKVNDYYFTNIVAVGDLGEAVGDVTVEQKSALGSFAYLLEGTKAAIRNKNYEMTITTSEKVYKEDVMFFLCTLTNSVGSFQKIAEDASYDDGQLHVFILKKGNLLNVVQMAKNLLSGNADKDEQIMRFDVQSIKVESNESIQANVDGDLLTETPLEISILQKHIQFYH